MSTALRNGETVDAPVDFTRAITLSMNEEVGRFDPDNVSATVDALVQVGIHWDANANAGTSFNGKYSFVLDGHRFEVTVTPVDL